MDNRLSIQFGKDKTKSIFFASKRKVKKVPKLNINYYNIKKQHSKVTYLGWILNETTSGESMTLKVIKLNFYREKTNF